MDVPPIVQMSDQGHLSAHILDQQLHEDVKDIGLITEKSNTKTYMSLKVLNTR
jgi:hypothetical protein